MYGLNPLRRARQAKGLTLDDVERITQLSPHVLARIELGDFESLPPGLFARAHVRAYAEAVGLNGAETIERLAEHLPVADDPLEGLRRREHDRWSEAHPWLTWLADAHRWLAMAFASWRATYLNEPRDTSWRRRAAGVVDGIVLTASGAALVGGSAAITGSHADALMRQGFAPLALTWALVLVLYLGLTGGLGGRTPGAVLTGWAGDDDLRLSLSPRIMSTRAVRMLMAESLLVAVVSAVVGACQMRPRIPWLRRHRAGS